MKGKVKGYTATLKLGDQCAGVDSWTMDTCVGLFIEFIDQSCKKQYPAEGFQCKCKPYECEMITLMGNSGIYSRAL